MRDNRFLEVGTAASGDRGHVGRKGQRGGSLPLLFNPDMLKKAGVHANALTTDHMKASVLKTYNAVTQEERDAGMKWYPTAHDYAQQLATKYKVPITTAAGVISAMSPQLQWDTGKRNNMLGAEMVLANPDKYMNAADDKHFKGNQGYLGRSLQTAARIANGAALPQALGDGEKTQNFYQNIIDPTNTAYVTMDRHAISIAVGMPLSQDQQHAVLGTGRRYDHFAQAYRDAAAELSIRPDELQAVTWTHWIHEHSKSGAAYRAAHKTEAALRDDQPMQWADGFPDWLQPLITDDDYSSFFPGGLREGGPGSGDTGHQGRPGERGGSQPSAERSTATATIPKAKGEEPGVVAGEKPPWELKADAPPRYKGDTSIYSPALPDAHGNYVLGRRLQGTKLNAPGSLDQVAMYMFVPDRATTDQLADAEHKMESLSDHAQQHPGFIAYNDANGNLVKTTGNNYWIRGDYRDLNQLSDELTPKLVEQFGHDTYTTMMTDRTLGEELINKGRPLEHMRVVVPFVEGTPKDTVGEPSLSQDKMDQILSAMSGEATANGIYGRHVWEHADFNGMHLAVSAPTAEVDRLFPIVRAIGGAPDVEEDHGPHTQGATRFVKHDINLERYNVLGYHEGETERFYSLREEALRPSLRKPFAESFYGHSGRPGMRGGSVPSTAGAAAKDIATKGGTSISTTGDRPTGGYMVALDGSESAYMIPHGLPSIPTLRAHLADYITHHGTQLDKPGNYLGAYIDTQHGEIDFDVSKNLSSKTAAYMFGHDQDQKSLYGIAEDDIFPIMSDGERPSQSKGTRITESAQPELDRWRGKQFVSTKGKTVDDIAHELLGSDSPT